MKMKIFLITLLSTTLFISKVQAEESSSEDQCAVECKAGKNKVGFSDGNHARCSCFDSASSMVETVVNENVENPIAEDGEPLDDQNTDSVSGT